MFKQKSLFVVIAMLIISILSGCSNVKGDQNASSSGACSKQTNLPVQNNLSVQDVLSKSQQTMSHENGYIADLEKIVKTKSSSPGVENGKFIKDYNINSEIDQTNATESVNNNPLALHLVTKKSQTYSSTKFKSTTPNVTTNDEVYYDTGYNLNGTTGWYYDKLTGTGGVNTTDGKWHKYLDTTKTLYVKSPDFNQSEYLKAVQSWIQTAQKAGDVSMTQTSSGDYQVTIDIEPSQGNQALLQMLTNNMIKGMTSLTLSKTNKGIDMQVKFYKVKLLIDGRTFQYKSGTTDLSFTGTALTFPMTSTLHQTYTFKGLNCGRIEVPADAKNAN